MASVTQPQGKNPAIVGGDFQTFLGQIPVEQFAQKTGISKDYAKRMANGDFENLADAQRMVRYYQNWKAGKRDWWDPRADPDATQVMGLQ
jgi:hypothetical protein